MGVLCLNALSIGALTAALGESTIYSASALPSSTLDGAAVAEVAEIPAQPPLVSQIDQLGMTRTARDTLPVVVDATLPLI